MFKGQEPGLDRLQPQEYVAKKILPLARAYVASCLRARGYSQHRLARLLGVTQPMIYKYTRSEPSQYLEKLGDLGIPVGAAKLVLEELCDRLPEEPFMLAVAANILAHESDYCSRRPRDCSMVLCRGKTLIEEAYWIVLRRLLSTPGLYNIVPEVGSNLAYAPKGAESLGEVMGLDGRIIRVRPNRVLAAGRPVPGGSTHTGRIALKYARQWGSDAWAFAVRAPVIGSIAFEGVVVETEEGEGREPVAYLVSSDPQALLEAVRRLALLQG